MYFPGKSVRIGIVGCGEVVRTRHLPVLQKVGGCSITALADVNESRLQILSEQYSISIRSKNYQDLIESPDVDLIAVCVPPQMHSKIALDALKANKHIFIEKPLSLSLDECDALRIAATNTLAQVMVGYNLRYHRLLSKAREIVSGNHLGEIIGLHTSFTTRQKRAFIEGWRSTQGQGGDLISDLASHHFDLVANLLGTEITQVFARYLQTAGFAEAVGANAHLANGALLTSNYASGTTDQNVIEVSGTRGTLAIDFYRYDGLVFSPAGSFPGSPVVRLKQTAKSLLGLISWLKQKSQGGDYALSYQAMWQQFIDSIVHRNGAVSNLAESIRTTQVILAALESARTGKEVIVEFGPRTIPKNPLLKGRPSTESPPMPSLSAIVVVPDDFYSVKRTIQSLSDQTAARCMEAVLVVSDQKIAEVDESQLEKFYGYKIIEAGKISSIASAYSIGIKHAQAPLFVLTEDHSFPESNWAQVLINDHLRPWAAVGPAMINGNPDTLVSWADFYIAYGNWISSNHPSAMDHLPGHNSCYKRDILMTYGSELDTLLEAESVLHWRLRQDGYELLFDSAAKTHHLNFSRWTAWIQIQYYSGRMFAATRSHGWSFWRRLTFTLGSPLIPLVRLRRIYYQIRPDHSRGFIARLIPVLFMGLAFDGLGQMLGYSFGEGNSVAKAASFEFHRERYISHRVNN